MTLSQALTSFAGHHKGERINLFFHTSCVLAGEQELKRLSDIRDTGDFIFAVPSGVYYELMLLYRNGQSEEIRSNALFITHTLCGGRVSKKNTEDFYSYNSAAEHQPLNYKGNVLWAFYDVAAAEEMISFSEFSETDEKRVFLYFEDPIHVHDVPDNNRFFSLSSWHTYFTDRKVSLRNCKPINGSQLYKKIPENAEMYYYTDNGTCIRSAQLIKLEKGSGGEANVYRCSLFPGKVIKMYTETLPSANKVRKLKTLIAFSSKTKIKNAAFPERLVYNGKSQCVGFIMKEIKGKSLNDICCLDLWSIYDKRKVFSSLFSLIIEMRLSQISPADISWRNIIIDDESNAFLIDCDSFEVCCYPGSGTTVPYGSPDIDLSKIESEMRLPYMNVFSLTVLIYQIYMDMVNPLTSKYVNSVTADWRQYEFAGLPDAPGELSRRPAEKWMELSQAMRDVFYSEFTFKKFVSLGDLIKVLKL